MHDRSKVDTGNLGDRRTIVSLGKHTGEIVMNRTCEHSTESDPQEDYRAPHSSGKSTEDRAKSGDIQQLYQEQLPRRHDNIVDTIVDCDCRGLTIVRSECVVDK